MPSLVQQSCAVICGLLACRNVPPNIKRLFASYTMHANHIAVWCSRRCGWLWLKVHRNYYTIWLKYSTCWMHFIYEIEQSVRCDCVRDDDLRSLQEHSCMTERRIQTMLSHSICITVLTMVSMWSMPFITHQLPLLDSIWGFSPINSHENIV